MNVCQRCEGGRSNACRRYRRTEAALTSCPHPHLPSLGGSLGHADEAVKSRRSRFRERGTTIRSQLTASGAQTRWLDDLPGILAEGNAIRLLRNDSGHPTGAAVSRRQVQSLFTLFPALARAVSDTSAALATLPED